MIAYIVRRVLYVIPIALGVSVIIFGLVHIAPGDPLNAVVPPDAPKETVELLIKAYGFDKPLPVQYLIWLGKALEGDFGISYATGRTVSDAIAGGVVNTLILAVGGILIGTIMGCSIGALAGYFQGSWIDKLATGFAIAGVSVPHYWLGLVLVIIFSVELSILPAMGMGPGGSTSWVWDLEHFKHLILPVITLSVIPIGIITRSVRATIAEILTMEFIQTLEAKGLKKGRLTSPIPLFDRCMFVPSIIKHMFLDF